MRFFSSISVINIVKSKRILLKMRIKTDVAVTVLNRYCDITFVIWTGNGRTDNDETDAGGADYGSSSPRLRRTQ